MDKRSPDTRRRPLVEAPLKRSIGQRFRKVLFDFQGPANAGIGRYRLDLSIQISWYADATACRSCARRGLVGCLAASTGQIGQEYRPGALLPAHTDTRRWDTADGRHLVGPASAKAGAGGQSDSSAPGSRASAAKAGIRGGEPEEATAYVVLSSTSPSDHGLGDVGASLATTLAKPITSL